MKIAIDLQGLQTPQSRNRGIGRYIRAFLDALLAKPEPGVEYLLYANPTLPAPELDAPWNSRILYLPFSEDGLRQINETLLKTTLLAEKVDVVFLPSPIEMKFAVVPDFQDFPAALYVINYDLIPLVFADRYLADEGGRLFYERRLRNIRNADCIFTDSESTRQDTIRLLKIPTHKVVTISAGTAPFFQKPVPKSEHAHWHQAFASKFGINKPFVFCNGGGDRRKNMHGLIEAFSLLPGALQAEHQLVLTCRLEAHEETELREHARSFGMDLSSLVLTNFVTDEELKALYTLCKLFVFPSLYEGFGLPVVEAMASGAPVLAGNNSSQIELVPSDDYLVNAESPAAISEKIEAVLSNTELRERMAAAGPPQSGRFTWENVAAATRPRLYEAPTQYMESLQFGRGRTIGGTDQERIAYFSPLPPLPSGISDYSAEILPHLAQHYDLDLYVDHGYTPVLPEAESYRPRIWKYGSFERNLRSRPGCGYRTLLYQMGNSDYHLYIYSLLNKYAGITVLHDYNLSGLVTWGDRNRPDFGISFLEELKLFYKPERAEEIAHEVSNGRIHMGDLPKHGIYTNRRIFTRSLGVIVHNRWAYDKARAEHGDCCENIALIPHQMQPISAAERAAERARVPELRKKWGIPQDAFVFGSFGFIADSKRPGAILGALKQTLAEHPSAYALFVGNSHLGGDFTADIAKLGLTERVRITGFVDDVADFNECIALTDVCVNLRYPSNGETSGALLRILASGKPAIVTDIGSFQDYPNDIVYKLPIPDKGPEAEVADLAAAFLRMVNDAPLRERMGETAAAYVATEHAPERCASLYADFIEHVMSQPKTRRLLLADHVGREVAFAAEDNEDQQIAELFAPFAAAVSGGFAGLGKL